MRSSLLLYVLLASLYAIPAFSAEGMWTLDNLPRAELRRQYDFAPDDEWINKISHASLRLLPGCSASFVSATGLVLTNHHCMRRCLEALSTGKTNLLMDGYLAAKPSQELKCPGMELDRLEDVVDVTAAIKAATKGKTGKEFSRVYDEVATTLNDNCLHEKSDVVTRCDVVALYHGGKYVLHRYHRYVDARVVWAPELSVAFFGGDLDNYNYPRYDLDAAIIRLYENDKPVDNQDFFRINHAGPAADELLIEAGNPGLTHREMSMAQLKTIRDFKLPRMVILSSEYRGVLQQYRKSSSSAARVVANELYSVENSLKSWRGQLDMLNGDAFMNQKRDSELALGNFIAGRSEFSGAITARQEIERAELTYRAIGNEYYFLENEKGFLSKYFHIARILVRGAVERKKSNDARLPEFEELSLPETEGNLLSAVPIYPELEKIKLAWSLDKMREWLGSDHKVVRKILDGASSDVLASRMVDSTRLGDLATRRLLWTKPELVMTSNDPFIKLAFAVDEDARAIRERYELEVEGVEQRAGQQLADARFAMTQTDTYPDATYSLRLSFGEVRGWKEQGRVVDPFTFTSDAYHRQTGVEPFALPASWMKARASMSDEIPFNYVTTHDSVGGNSGSAIINRRAELVGLAFDGNIYSLGGVFGYDGNVNRAVAVHPAALLHALKVIYKADALLTELNPE